MKRAALLIIALLLFPPFSHAVDAGETLKGLSTFWDGIETFRCDFVQTKRLALFADEVVSRGTFAYKKPGIMVWRYAPPEDMIMEIKPGLVTLYFPGLRKAKRIHPSGTTDLPMGMSLGMGQTKDDKALDDVFSVTVERKKGATVMTLVPKGKAQAITKVVITMADDYTPLSTAIFEAAGDETLLEFTHQKINVPIDKAVFELTIPPGVVVEEIGR